MLQIQAGAANQEPSVSSSSDLFEEPPVEENVDAQEEDSADLGIPELSIQINPSGKPARKEDVDEKKVAPPQESIALTTQTTSVSQPDLESQNPADIEKSLKLSIHVKEISWFNMTIDDLREEDFILPAGTSKTFWGNEAIRLTIGNKTGVELVLNGKAITLPESEDKVVKDFIIHSKLVD